MLLSGTFLFLLLSSLSLTAKGLNPKCGNCWCTTFGDDANATCPPEPEGIVDSFPPEFSAYYESFQLTNDPDFLKLRTPEGEACYPFADTLGEQDGFELSKLPQCSVPVSTDETVCAYKYETPASLTMRQAGQQCNGRNYEIITYDSVEAAQSDGAVVVHRQACGVCSSAADLAVRMRLLENSKFEEETLVCGVAYFISSNSPDRFDNLIECAQNAGMSAECSLLWAHMGVATVSECVDVCLNPEFQGPPPRCEAVGCSACPTAFNRDFPAMAGFTLIGSGMTEQVGRQCSEYYPVSHDPCVGAVAGPPPGEDTEEEEVPDVGAATTSSPNPSASQGSVTVTGLWSAIISLGLCRLLLL